MTVPEPPMSLDGHCSAVYNNTLYVYSPYGFASLSLAQNTTSWSTLPPGMNVTGAACVTAAIDGNKDDLAFYVVGGTGNSSYFGLQRYSYQDQEWLNLASGSSPYTDRLGHGVGYFEDAGTILMYGGEQGYSGASQSTYLIYTTYPYTVDSMSNQGAPAALDPMLLNWNESTIALIGGYSSTTDVYIFSNGSMGWVASGATVSSELASETGRFAILSDDDGNKILEDFDLEASPNTITSYEIIKDGIAQAATVVGSSSKRSLSNYPSYDSKNAPTTSRSDYAIAQSSDNLVVITSGSGNNSVSIFNQTANSWINTTELFYGSGTQKVLHTTTTSSSTSTAMASSTFSTVSTTPSSSPTATAAASGDSGERVGVIIGATLGGVCGAIVILVAILIFLRRTREKQNPTGKGKEAGKDRLSFQDQGIEPLAERAYPMAKSPVPVASMSDDSLAIISGKYAGEKALRAPNQTYGYGLGKQSLSPIPSSGLAPSSMYSDDSDRSAAIASAVEAISSPGNKPGDRTTDEGWGKYFDDNRASNFAGDRSTISSTYTKSDYRGSSAWPMSNLAPLDFGFLDKPKPLGQVNSGSPTTEVGGHTGRSLVIPESQSARISSADSVSICSDDDPHDTNWTGAAHSSWLGRPTSSNYSNSYYGASNTNLPATNSQSYARQSNARKSSVIVPDNIDELAPSGTYNSDMSWLNLHAER